MGDHHDKGMPYKIPDLLILIPIRRIPMMMITIMEMIEEIAAAAVGMEITVGTGKDTMSPINP
jgi:hypothetical protein